MKCEKAKRLVSDALDGALSRRRADRLERHLAGCAGCRAYRRDAALTQENAGGLADPRLAPAAWEDFGRRLEARLAAASGPAAPPPARAGLPVLWRSKWAWATAAIVVLAFAVTYFAGVRTRPTAEPAIVPFEDSLARVLGEADESPAVENSFNQEILASIDETVRPAGAEAPVSFGDNPLFWEALSEGELSYIESALRQEKGLGGVS